MRLICILLMVIMVAPANATIYKWVDENGQVHYSSKRGNDNAREMQIKDRYIDNGKSQPAASTEERLQNQQRFLDASEQERESINKEKEKQKEEQEKKQRNCVIARDNLDRYQASRALYEMDEKGNRCILDEAEYKRTMEKAHKLVEQWCN